MILNTIGSLLIVMLVILVNTDVIGRSVFGAPLSGVPEIVSLSIAAIVFLQVAYTVQQGKLTRSDALLTMVGKRFPKLKLMVEALFNMIAAILVAVLFSVSYPFFLKAWSKNTFVGSIGDFTAPIWPIKLIIMVGCAALFCQFLMGCILCCYQAVLSPRKERL
ncbi:TRAP transporter small permease [Vibrio sp. Of7-15]|nr:TRAP transporter small permease [Vibrio sp. Of7-15]